MSIESVRAYLSRWNKQDAIIETTVSTATVAEAAAALGVVPARIAKSISLKKDGGAFLLITAGDMKLDNKKFKDHFGFKAKMLSTEEAPVMTGHAVGGICPFALPAGVEVYLDVSMRRFSTVFPACGSPNSAIELTLDELNEYAHSKAWVDVCKSSLSLT